MDDLGKILPFSEKACKPADAAETLKLLKVYMAIRKPSDRQKAFRMVEEFAARLKSE